MTEPIHVLALSGSLRQDSHNTARCAPPPSWRPPG